jgi:hypothetical protein
LVTELSIVVEIYITWGARSHFPYLSYK